MGIETEIIEFWEKLKNIVFASQQRTTTNYFFSKTNVVEFDSSENNLIVICTAKYVYDTFVSKQKEIEKAYYDKFNFTVHLVLLDDSVPVDVKIYTDRIDKEDREEAERKEKEKQLAREDLRRSHPEYFRDNEVKGDKSDADDNNNGDKGDKEKNTPGMLEDAVKEATDTSDEDFSKFIDYREFEANGKKHRIGSTMSPFKPEYTFDTYLEGESNKFAKAACTAVATKPAAGYNPLFIYGASGLGKTHLLYAITTRIRELYPDKKVMYITSEQFTNQMVKCLSLNAMHEFRELYRTRDVLLIDDIQFIEGKKSTQEEMFHTINAMIESGCQMIFTSDRSPNEMKDIPNRLRTRFEWGLTADIQPPDLELRIAIFKSKAENKGLVINDDVILFLAENLRSNVRQIEGAINRFAARSFILGMHGVIDMEYARKCLPDLLGEDEPISVTVDKIFAAIYEKYGVSKEQLISPARTKDIAYARKIAIFLIKKKAGLSVTSISHLFDRDHSTITASLNDVSAKQMKDARIMGDLNEFYGKLKITR